MKIQFERDDPECLTSFMFEDIDEMTDFQDWLKQNNMSYKKIKIPSVNGVKMSCLIVENKPAIEQVEEKKPIKEEKKQVVEEEEYEEEKNEEEEEEVSFTKKHKDKKHKDKK